jgi:hypothetical protein
VARGLCDLEDARGMVRQRAAQSKRRGRECVIKLRGREGGPRSLLRGQPPGLCHLHCHRGQAPGLCHLHPLLLGARRRKRNRSAPLRTVGRVRAGGYYVGTALHWLVLGYGPANTPRDRPRASSSGLTPWRASAAGLSDALALTALPGAGLVALRARSLTGLVSNHIHRPKRCCRGSGRRRKTRHDCHVQL